MYAIIILVTILTVTIICYYVSSTILTSLVILLSLCHYGSCCFVCCYCCCYSCRMLTSRSRDQSVVCSFPTFPPLHVRESSAGNQESKTRNPSMPNPKSPKPLNSHTQEAHPTTRTLSNVTQCRSVHWRSFWPASPSILPAAGLV